MTIELTSRHGIPLRAIMVVCLLLLWGTLFSQTKIEGGWTDNEFPSYIKRLNYFGERPDWSHDGKKILFVSRSFGDVYELEIATGLYKPLTHHYYHGGYLRALYLSNGDILLLGPKTFSPENWQEARFKLTELWILRKELDSPPVRLGEFIWEGPAVSRTSLKIAWAQHHGNYPEQSRYWQIWLADIDYSSGSPRIANQRVVLDNAKGEVKGVVIEPQNFRPGNEKELTIQSFYKNYQTNLFVTETYMLNTETGVLVNYSKSPESYNEPEGIFPDGKYTLVESSRHRSVDNGGKNIDLYKFGLDEPRTWERLTWFNENGVFKTSNPVVSDDGKFIAFMVARCEEVAGIGHGIYIFDIEEYEASKAQSEH